MRAFLAIELDEATRELLSGVSERIRKPGFRASWVKPENLHVTVRFLGEISEEDANRFGEFAARHYGEIESFSVRARGLGCFPNAKNARVLWAGLDGADEVLQRVYEIAESAAEHIGVAAEKRRFHPHVTLARFRESPRAGTLADAMKAHEGFEGDAFLVGGVSLFSSELHPKGARYRRLRTVEFSWT